MAQSTIAELLEEYDRALAYTDSLWTDLSAEEISWREHDEASGIGWHIGHQPAVAHFMVRNLTAAEPPITAALDSLMDSATPEAERGTLPDRSTLASYRDEVAERVRFRIGNIDTGKVGAPVQLRIIAHTLMVAVINHEYQHSKWVGEVRTDVHGKELPPAPTSDRLSVVDGYYVIES